MTTKRPVHLLTVLHAAERTGPPLFAQQLLHWLRAARPDWQLSTLFLDAGGPLVEEFEEFGPVILADGRAPYRVGRSLPRRVLTWADGRSLRRQLLQTGPIDLTHVHCIGSLKVLPVLPIAPVVAHLHELSVGQELHLGPRARSHATGAHRYVAVSEGVRSEFLERFPVPADLVERQWGFVDPARLEVEPDRATLRAAPDDFVVATSGVRHWRKAPELFVRLAQLARAAAPDIAWQFRWIGGEDTGGLESLVRDAGLENLVRFLPHQPAALRLVAASDVFVLPAREDAFPLVCVEAAALGRPIVTFDNGGAAELVEAAGCGEVVPFPDLLAFAARLVDLARDPARRTVLGEAGRTFAREHLLVDQAGPKLLATFERVLGPGR